MRQNALRVWREGLIFLYGMFGFCILVGVLFIALSVYLHACGPSCLGLTMGGLFLFWATLPWELARAEHDRYRRALEDLQKTRARLTSSDRVH